MKHWVRQRAWFGWWWASICSAAGYDPLCLRCNAGGWHQINSPKTFGVWNPRTNSHLHDVQQGNSSSSNKGE